MSGREYYKVTESFWDYSVNGWEYIKKGTLIPYLGPRTGNELTKEEVCKLWSKRLKESLANERTEYSYLC